MYDRMDAVGKGMLGLTIQCAQCHSHKFDPITQEEYYKLFAFLNNDHEGTMVAYSAPEQMQISEITRKIRELEDGLRHTTSDWQERMNKWEEANRTLPTKWNVATVTNTSDGDQRYTELKDNSILAAGYAPTQFSTRMRTTNVVAGNHRRLPLGIAE